MGSPAPQRREPVRISVEELAAFCDFFERKTGIRLDEQRRYYVERRLLDRMGATGAAAFREYFSNVRLGAGDELQQLINEMTVNETYFYREDYQFQALVRHMLDELVATKAPGRPLKIWSAPCSTGEEPYSLAIWILEHWAQADRHDIELHASDIDSRVVRRAQEGLFDARALHRVPAAIRQKYFTPESGERWRICSELRESVEFRCINVTDPVQMARQRDFDVIFCRNLLIYFSDHARRQTMDMFHESLRPGGFMCLGHSESMSRMSGLFLPRKFPEALVHQRPLA